MGSGGSVRLLAQGYVGGGGLNKKNSK